MVHRFFKIFSVDRGFRYSVAVNETVVKLHGLRACCRCRFRGDFSHLHLTGQEHATCFEVP